MKITKAADLAGCSADLTWLALQFDEQELMQVDWSQLGRFTNLLCLTLRDTPIQQLPAAVYDLKGLQELRLDNSSTSLQKLAELSEDFGNLTALQELRLQCSSLKQLPESFGSLGQLLAFNGSGCSALTQLPKSFGSLRELQELKLSFCSSLTGLPESFGSLGQLHSLALRYCSSLTQLPESFGSLGQLHRLYLISCSSLTQLPKSFGRLGELQDLDLEWSSLTGLPESFGSLVQLSRLNLSYCSSLTQLPGSFGSLGKLKTLNCTSCGSLTGLPESFGSLGELHSLDLSRCSSLTQLPKSFGSLGNLQQLSLSRCRSLAGLPESFGSLGQLHSLDLSYCSSLTQLPDSFCSLGQLGRLFLSECSCRICLPDLFGSLQVLQHLELFGCSALTQLPESFGSLGQLQQLGLTNCSSLKQLPNSFVRLTLTSFRFEGCPGVRNFRLGLQQAVVMKLATQQEPMLATLERMSWLVVLLATATFVAFAQPPGSYKDDQVRASEIQACTNAAMQDCAMLLFFVLDGLSFGLSMGCLVMIVTLSMPRIQWDNKLAEAGRFYLLLLCTWVLLYLAVSTGFAAFIAAGFAVHKQVNYVIVPVAPGMLLVLIGGVLMWKRFRALYPGGAAIHAALSYEDHGVAPVVDDVELGQAKFWRDYLSNGRVQTAAAAGQTATSAGEHSPLLAQQAAGSSGASGDP